MMLSIKSIALQINEMSLKESVNGSGYFNQWDFKECILYYNIMYEKNV